MIVVGNYSFEEAVNKIKKHDKGTLVSLPEAFGMEWPKCPGNHGVYGRAFRKYVEGDNRGIVFAGVGKVTGRNGKVARYRVLG